MHWFTQRLDHFDRQNGATWQQRSFQNASFFDGTGPVFLCVGGEGPPLDASVLVASVHCNDMVELAPQVGRSPSTRAGAENYHQLKAHLFNIYTYL